MKRSVPTIRIAGYVVVIAALLVFYGALVFTNFTTSGTLLSPGSEAPPIKALGWLNGGPVPSDQLAGNVVVIDNFATWCAPCAMMAPDLVQTYLKYQDQGVQFIGLTSEPGIDVDRIDDFIGKHDTRWPVGYSANETMAALGVTALPSIVVVGRDGRVAGAIEGTCSAGEIGQLIDSALAAN